MKTGIQVFDTQVFKTTGFPLSREMTLDYFGGCYPTGYALPILFWSVLQSVFFANGTGLFRLNSISGRIAHVISEAAYLLLTTPTPWEYRIFGL